ncbi:kinase-like protein [Ceraceosorus bombacis]|uniref:Aurora kinase n=1 Tax=Ceraceosorus bombacis TaxID=401625 RepID=A0A0P1B845_9BASI|nr:kinase-like protein [Ceraceosorus bombacis]
MENLQSATSRLDLKGSLAPSASSSGNANAHSRLAFQVQPLHGNSHSNIPPSPTSLKPQPHHPHHASQGHLRKASVDGSSSNNSSRQASATLQAVNTTKPAASASAAGQGASASSAILRHVDIGKYDGSMERDERKGRRTMTREEDEKAAILAIDSASNNAHKPTRKWALKEFEVGRAMGKGRFGRVYIARTKADAQGSGAGFIVALKLLYKKEIVSDMLETQVRREIEIQMNLRHPNVLRIYGYFTDQGRIFMALEFAARGEMYKIMSKLRNGKWSEPEAGAFAGQMADGLAYLHSKNVIHRDIKPENLLIGLDNKLKIADFGWSVHAPGDRRTTQCGTLDYMAPELTDPGTPHGHGVDLWAFGILIYEFLNGTPPFDSLDERNVDRDQFETYNHYAATGKKYANFYTKARIKTIDYSFPDEMPNQAKDLVNRLLQVKPAQRLPLDQVMQHPWIKKWDPTCYQRCKEGNYVKDTPAHQVPHVPHWTRIGRLPEDRLGLPPLAPAPGTGGIRKVKKP